MPITGILIGEMIAMRDDARTPLIVYPGQPGTAALAARSVVDLHGAHIGKQVVLMFERGNPARPIVMGVLREGEGWPLEERPGQVEVDADGGRLIVSAKEQVVLRCGKASITLTKAGKVLIEGTYVLSRSTGVNRIKGGSVHIN
jgi:phage baseplate assembly protein gpV